jgi:hypothetical protein
MWAVAEFRKRERKAYVDDAGFRNKEEGGCGLLQSSEIDRKADVG